MPSGGDRGARPRTSTPRYRAMPVDPPNTRSGRYANNPNRPNTHNLRPNQNDNTPQNTPQTPQNPTGRGGASTARDGAAAANNARESPQQPRPSRPEGPQILQSIAAEIIARGAVPGGGLNPVAGGGASGGASRNTRGHTAGQTPGVDVPPTPSRPPVTGGVPTVGGTPNSRQGIAADTGRPAGTPGATPAAGSVTVPPVLPVPPTRPNNRGQGDNGIGSSRGPISQQGGTTPDLDEIVLQSLAPSMNERRRVLNQSSDTGSHSSDWDHSGDIGAGNGNRRRNRRRGNGTYSELADTVTNLTTVLAGAQTMWEQRYNLLDEKLSGVENRHEDERLNLAGRLETLSGHLRNALGQVHNDNETQQTWNVETRERLRHVESTLEGVREQVSATSRDDTPLLGASDANRDALRDLNRKIQTIGTNLDKVNQKADNIRGDLNHQVNDTQQAISGFRSDVAAVNTIATDLQGSMNDLNTIRNSVNDLTVEQATLRRLDTDMTTVKRGVQDNTRQLDRHVNDLRLSVNTLRDQFSTTHESCTTARLLQDRVNTLNNEFRVFLRTLEGQGVVPPGTSNDYTEPCMADTNMLAPDASTPNRHGLLRTRTMPPTPGLLGMSTGAQPQNNNGAQGGVAAVPPTGTHIDLEYDINDLRCNQTLDDLRMCSGGVDTVAPPPTANAANGANKKLFEECAKAIKIYDGADSTQFRPWIRSIEKATSCGIYSPHKVAHMKSIGALEKVVRQNMHRTWGDLKQVLQHRFSDLRTDQDTVRALASCRQGSGSVAAYIDEFTELVAGATSTASYIQQFIDGLSNRLVRNALVVTWRKGSTTTLNDIMDMASEKDKIYGDMEDVDLVGQLLTTNNMASVQRGASLNEVIAREVSNHFLRNKEYDPSNRARDPGGEGDSSQPSRDGRRGRFGKWLPRHLFLAKMREMLNQKVKERDEGDTPKDSGQNQSYNKKVAPGYHTAVGPHV